MFLKDDGVIVVNPDRKTIKEMYEARSKTHKIAGKIIGMFMAEDLDVKTAELILSMLRAEITSNTEKVKVYDLFRQKANIGKGESK